MCIEICEVNAEPVILSRLPINDQYNLTSYFASGNTPDHTCSFQLTHFLLDPLSLLGWQTGRFMKKLWLFSQLQLKLLLN